ncbi:unnamed protein product [Caenorhabditis nigoni]
MEKVKFPILLLHLICSWCDCYYSIITTPVLLFPSTAGYAMGILYYIIPSWLLSYIGFVSASLIAMSLILVFENRTAWCDFFISILSTPVFLFPATAGYVMGIMDYILPTWLFCYIGFVSISLIGPSLTLLFENRYNFLVRKDSESSSRKVKRLLHISINIIFTFLIVYPPFQNHSHVPDFREILHQEYPCLPEKIIQHPRLYFMIASTSTAFLCLSLDLLCPTIQVFFFFFSTTFHLYRNSKSFSSRTAQLQNQLFKAMCIQIFIPFTVIVIPGIYFLFIFATGYLNLAFNNLTVICVTSHGAFSTIVMLIVHVPYRSATLQVFGIRKIEVPKTSRTHPINSQNISF